MCVDEVQARASAPVPQQPRLDVVRCERSLKKKVVLQVDLSSRKIVRASALSVHGAKRFLGHDIAIDWRRFLRLISYGGRLPHHNSSLMPDPWLVSATFVNQSSACGRSLSRSAGVIGI